MTGWMKLGLVAGGLFGLKLWHDSRKLANALKEAANKSPNINQVGGNLLPTPVPREENFSWDPATWKILTSEASVGNANPNTAYGKDYNS